MTISDTYTSRRRGVILLLVLAVMAMFAMLIATFLVISSQQYRQADSSQKAGRYVHSPEDDLHGTVVQMLVGDNSKSSAIRTHSLSATAYGDARQDGLTGTVNNIWGETNHALLVSPMKFERFGIELAFDNTGSLPQSVTEWLALKGNVITMYDGVQKRWTSARILDFDSTTAAFTGGRLSSITIIATAIPGTQIPTGAGTYVAQLNSSIQNRFLNTQPFYINPPAFAGTGAGYVAPVNASFGVGHASSRLMEVDSDGFLFARQLNPNAPTLSGLAEFDQKLDDYAWQLNTDYTAADATSPFLGWFDMQFDPMTGNFLPNDSVIIPSYHRPSLIAQYNPSTMTADELRKLVVRPLPFDHPEFDGSNPTMNATLLADLVARLSDPHGFYLDVDTDGDGIKDSIWVDAGLPVRTDINGRTYKPLVAIKCVDLDGKLNLNAIGNFTETALSNTAELRGSGFGPAGINLSRGLKTFMGDYLSDLAITDSVTEKLYIGRYGSPKDTTYQLPKYNYASPSDVPPSVLAQFGGLPGFYSNAVNDYFNTVGYGNWYAWTSHKDNSSVVWWTALANRFGNLPDQWDQSNLLFDPLGNRFNSFHGAPFSLTGMSVWEDPLSNDTFPYLFDPNRSSPYDQPFTLPELEAVLRQNDLDKNALPERLRSILGLNDVNGVPQEPEVLKISAYHTTTLSSDLPVPGPALADMGYASLYELIRGCVEKSGVPTANIDTVALQLIDFLPDEIKQGGKVNLNKLVEDPTMFLADLGPTTVDYEAALYERMKMARGIYIILMALSYDKLYGVDDGTGTGVYAVEPYIEPSYLQTKKIKDLYDSTTPGHREEALRICRELATTRLAQWAVNVVEFTDTDAVMTPFVFDANPFDGAGWGTRNITDVWGLYSGTNQEFACIGTHDDYRLIWGMERPDLLLTETIAFHNRNVADTEAGGLAVQTSHSTYITIDPATGVWSFDLITTPTTPVDIKTVYADEDFDQIRMPQGPAFLELYNATDPNRASYPQELYNGKELDLSRLTGNIATGDPVWRTVVSESNYKGNGKKYNAETEAKMEYSIPHRLKDFGPLFTFQTNQPGSAVPVIPSFIPIDDAIYTDFKELNEPFAEDRIVWFTPKQPPTTAENVYYNRSNVITDRLTLGPNEHLVVGPRTVTFLTSQRFSTAYGDPTGSPKIDLLDLVSSSSPIGSHKVMVAAADVSSSVPIAGWDPTNDYSQTNYLGDIAFGTGLGFSISEPFRSAYYKQPKFANSNLAAAFGVTTIVDAYATLNVKNPTNTADVEHMEESIDGSKPISAAGLVGTGVAPFYKSVFLQRVADPNRPYDAVTNPYITVDWNMFDLKVYTGESVDADSEDTNFFTPPLEEGVTKHFASRQWGVPNALLPARASALPNPWDRSLDWSKVPKVADIDISTAASDFGVFQGIELTTGLLSPVPLPYQPNLVFSGTLAFDQFPVHSLGRLGTDPNLLHPNMARVTLNNVVVPMSAAQAALPAVNVNGFYQGAPIRLNNIPSRRTDMSVAASAGDPDIFPEQWTTVATTAFQHLPWHNGPMANSYEVMQVPATSSGRFGVEFFDRKGDTGVYDTNYLMPGHLWATRPNLHVDDLPTSVDGTHVNLEKRSGSLGSNVRFGHLLNFQHAHLVDGLDYTNSGMSYVASPNDTYLFANNTLPLVSSKIPTADLWQHGFPLLTFDFTDRPDHTLTVDAADTRDTVGSVTKAEFVSLDLGNFLNFVNVPSRFVGTRDWHYDSGKDKWYSYSRFREPGKINLNTMTASGLAALLENREFAGSVFGTGVYEQFDELRGNDVAGNGLFLFDTPFRGSGSSLLNANSPYESAINATLLLDDPNDAGVPIFAPAIDDTNITNSYTAFEGIQRLSDMTTTRSNVFAIWLTLGYFEVEKIQPGQTYNGWTAPSQPTFQAIYPDGYMLKKEVGLETGEIKRHRAFYIIDRSIPYGYRRGQKLNSEDAILLKRFIE